MMAFTTSCWRALVVFRPSMLNDVMSVAFCGAGFGMTVSEFCSSVPNGDTIIVVVAMNNRLFFVAKKFRYLPFEFKHEMEMATFCRFSVDFLLYMQIVESVGHVTDSQVSVSIWDRMKPEHNLDYSVIINLNLNLPGTSALVRAMHANAIQNRKSIVSVCCWQIGVEKMERDKTEHLLSHGRFE